MPPPHTPPLPGGDALVAQASVSSAYPHVDLFSLQKTLFKDSHLHISVTRTLPVAALSYVHVRVRLKSIIKRISKGNDRSVVAVGACWGMIPAISLWIVILNKNLLKSVK